MKFNDIPQATIERLPLYYRTVKQLEERGIDTVSSEQLGGFLNFKAVQIRKDLAFFGNFGIKSIGYVTADLMKSLSKVLGYQYRRKIGIVGTGNLGMFLAGNETFSELGFQIAAIFDIEGENVGSEVGNVKVYDFEKIDSIAPRKKLDIGVIAVQPEIAQNVADILVAVGIKGIWNFAPVKIFVPKNVQIMNVDLSFSLSVLNFQMTHSDDDD